MLGVLWKETSVLVATVWGSKEAGSESWLLPGSRLSPRDVFSWRVEFWADERWVRVSCPSRDVCLLHRPPSPYLSALFLHLSVGCFHSMAVSGLIKIKTTHLATLTPPAEVKTIFKYICSSRYCILDKSSAPSSQSRIWGTPCSFLDNYLKRLS